MKNNYKKSIKIFAPGTVSNVGCGFDTIGFALNEPGEIVVVSLRKDDKIVIKKITGDNGTIPYNIKKNTASVAVNSFLKKYNGSNIGVELEIRKKMPTGGGLGSSAASAVAAVYGLNKLLGNPFTKMELLDFAMDGEAIASGGFHADNVAPALLGGITLIRDYNPIDIIKIPPPKKLFCTVLHSNVIVETKKARKLIKDEISLKSARRHFGNMGTLIAGFYESDFEKIGKAIEDEISEPVRSKLIPGFYEIKNAALDAGAYGCSISGSGPSIFAFSQNKKDAEIIGKAMSKAAHIHNLKTKIFISTVNNVGPKVIN
ncbi:MAG: homoserine kinase [Ignavibacteriae bacterium]|nr:homoserine kinase [Ignavibacteriota bacterium]